MSAPPFKDLYEVLGVSPTASDEDIKKQYRQLIKVWHPDKRECQTGEGLEKSQDINYAFSILKDSEKRTKYDVEWVGNMKKKAEELKAEGNDQFRQGKMVEAIRLYSQALSLDPLNHIFFSNRSMAFAALGKWDESKADAEKCVSMNEKHLKGHFNLCRALLKTNQISAAQGAIQRALGHFPGDQDLIKLKTELISLSELHGTGRVVTGPPPPPAHSSYQQVGGASAADGASARQRSTSVRRKHKGREGRDVTPPPPGPEGRSRDVSATRDIRRDSSNPFVRTGRFPMPAPSNPTPPPMPAGMLGRQHTPPSMYAAIRKDMTPPPTMTRRELTPVQSQKVRSVTPQPVRGSDKGYDHARPQERIVKDGENKRGPSLALSALKGRIFATSKKEDQK